MIKNRLTILLFILLFINSKNAFSQAPGWAFYREMTPITAKTSPYPDLKVTTDKEGNSYVAGVFYDSTITFGSTILMHKGKIGNYNAYIVKYDSSGQAIWAKAVEGITIYSISVDLYGNVGIFGWFYSSSISIESITIGNTYSNPYYNTYSNPYYNSCGFIAKFDKSGKAIWAKSLISDYDQITSDNSGNTYVTGALWNGKTMTNIFITKYDNLGNLVWENIYAGNNWDRGTCLTTDSLGNIYVAGIFSSNSISFGSTTLINEVPGGSNLFLVKYDPQGHVLFAKIGNASSVDVLSITLDNSGNIYMTGGMYNSIKFESTVLTSWDHESMYIVKFNKDGNLIWAKQAGGGAVGISNTVDTKGNVYVVGDLSGISYTSFDSIKIYDKPNYHNLFIVKYGPAGNAIWAKTFGYPSNFVISDANDNIYVNGRNGGVAIIAKIAGNPFSAGTISGNAIVCQGQRNITYAIPKITNATSYIWTLPDGTTTSTLTNSISLTFDSIARSGELKVRGHNTTADGAESTLFINVKVTPAQPQLKLIDNILYSDASLDNEWFRNNTKILNATSNSYTIKENGSYSARITREGCSSKISNNISYLITGIDEFSNREISIYPNPTNNSIEIFINEDTLPISAIEIYNYTGIRMQKEEINNNIKKIKIDISSYPPGIYIVKINCNNRLITNRIVVNK
jgi:hypothetical protein